MTKNHTQMIGIYKSLDVRPERSGTLTNQGQLRKPTRIGFPHLHRAGVPRPGRVPSPATADPATVVIRSSRAVSATAPPSLSPRRTLSLAAAVS
jgi:hypothetical protein